MKGFLFPHDFNPTPSSLSSGLKCQLLHIAQAFSYNSLSRVNENLVINRFYSIHRRGKMSFMQLTLQLLHKTHRSFTPPVTFEEPSIKPCLYMGFLECSTLCPETESSRRLGFQPASSALLSQPTELTLSSRQAHNTFSAHQAPINTFQPTVLPPSSHRAPTELTVDRAPANTF